MRAEGLHKQGRAPSAILLVGLHIFDRVDKNKILAIQKMKTDPREQECAPRVFTSKVGPHKHRRFFYLRPGAALTGLFMVFGSDLHGFDEAGPHVEDCPNMRIQRLFGLRVARAPSA